MSSPVEGEVRRDYFLLSENPNVPPWREGADEDIGPYEIRIAHRAGACPGRP